MERTRIEQIQDTIKRLNSGEIKTESNVVYVPIYPTFQFSDIHLGAEPQDVPGIPFGYETVALIKKHGRWVLDGHETEEDRLAELFFKHADQFDGCQVTMSYNDFMNAVNELKKTENEKTT